MCFALFFLHSPVPCFYFILCVHLFCLYFFVTISSLYSCEFALSFLFHILFVFYVPWSLLLRFYIQFWLWIAYIFAIYIAFIFLCLSSLFHYAIFVQYPKLFLSVRSYSFVCACVFVFCFLYEFSIPASMAIDSPFPCLSPTPLIVIGNVSYCYILQTENLPSGVPNVTASGVVRCIMCLWGVTDERARVVYRYI
jgi:hypothetical protein